METKHTPGPWTAGWIGNVGEPGLGRPCVGTSGAADWVGPEGAEADARLIAASPTLRDFVQRVANQTRETMGGCAGLVDDARDLLKTLA